MLTGDAHEGDLRIRGDLVAGLLATVEEIAVEANPLHVTSLENLVATNHGDVVLCLTRGHASVATRAGIQIDRHAPLLE
jgi:hypothetical protein